MTKFLQALLRSILKHDKTYKELSKPKSVYRPPDKDDLYVKIDRTWYSGKSTIGKMYVDGKFECYTLEDPVRPAKIDGETAIPAGVYEVVINHSPKYKRQMPRLKDVPGFTGILIHWGNYPKDTMGCLLVGETRDVDYVGRSKKAFNALFKKLKDAKEAGKKIYITIND